MLKILQRFQWPLVTITIAAGVAYTVVLGFGETLGIDPAVQETFKSAFATVRNLAATFLLPLFLKDTDKDGTPDILDTDPGLADKLEP